MTSISHRPSLFKPFLAGLAGLMVLANMAMAQNPFSAAVRVNDDIVTYYEIEQRQLFAEALNSPDTDFDVVLETLINERLQVQAGQMMGVAASDDEIEAGVEEFAGRANMGPEQFIRALAEEGIAPETFRDFVSAGITWRNVLSARFGARARPSDEEVDRAVASGITTGGIRIRISELIVPLLPQNEATLESEMARLANDVDGSFERFAEMARRFSAAPSREEGGLTDWRPLTALPPAMQAMFQQMSPGDVTEPINLGNAVGIFQLRALGETPLTTPQLVSVDYLTVAIPGGQSAEAQAEAARLRGAVDTCDDFYGVLPGGFERVEQPIAQIADDIAVALSRLDNDEIATDVLRGNGTVLLMTMLCGRTYAADDEDRSAVGAALMQQRMEAFSSNYIEELRTEAIITYAD